MDQNGNRIQAADQLRMSTSRPSEGKIIFYIALLTLPHISKMRDTALQCSLYILEEKAVNQFKYAFSFEPHS